VCGLLEESDKFRFLHISSSHCLGVNLSHGQRHPVIRKMTSPTCRYDERQTFETKVEGSTHLVYTGLVGGLEHLKIETRLTDEKFTSVMGSDAVHKCTALHVQMCSEFTALGHVQ
jgi:hypothetical protein